MRAPLQLSNKYSFGVFEVDLSKGELLKHGTRVKIQVKPLQLLAILLKSSGEIVTREELRQQLWPDGTFIEFDDGLNGAMKKLRIALCDSAENPRFIETLPRQGYRFIADVVDRTPDEEISAPVAHLEEPASTLPARKPWVRRTWMRLAAVALAAMAVAGSGWYFFRPARAARVNLQAVQEYQQGRELWRQRTGESLAKAIDHFEKAAKLDPTYAEAYSGLADSYIVLPFLSTITPEVAYPRARAAAERAVALDPSLAEAHTSAADVKLYADWDFAGAEREFRRALELNRNYATAHQWYAEYLSLMGRHEEAIREILRAEELEPLSIIMYHQAGQIYQDARQYDRAIQHYERALQIDPAFDPSCMRLAAALRHKGMYRDSIETQLEFYKRHTTSFYDPGEYGVIQVESLSRGFATGGEKGYWRARLELQKPWMDERGRGFNGGGVYYLALDLAQTGDFDNAMRWLNKLYMRRADEILSIGVDPDLDPLRADPRFQELVKRIGLP